MGWRISPLGEPGRKVAPNELPKKRLDDLLLLARRGRKSLLGLQSTAPLDQTCQALIVPATLATLLTLPASHRFHRKTSLRLVMCCEMFCVLSDGHGLAEERLFERCGSRSAWFSRDLICCGAKPEWLLRIRRGKKVCGYGRWAIKSCSRNGVCVGGIWSSCGKFLEVLPSNWRKDFLIGTVAFTVMAIVEAAFE